MRCAVCSHSHRRAIEDAVARDEEIAEVAERFGISELALARHGAHGVAAPKKKKDSPPRASAARARATHTQTPRPRTRAPLTRAEVLEEDDPPATSRSPQRTVTARSKLDGLLERVDRLLDEVEGDGEDVRLDHRIAAIRAAVVPLKLLGQFTGELGVSEATVASSTHFKRLLDVILEALRPREFSAARAAVIAALDAEQRGRPTEAAA